MADSPASERTEQATPERLKKAREEGRVAQSQEVPSALITGGVLMVLAVYGGDMLGWFRNLVSEAMLSVGGGPNGEQVFSEFLRTKGFEAIAIMMPFLIVCGLISCFSSVLVSGLTYSPKALKFDFAKVNPMKGIKNVISGKAVVRLITSLVKMTVISLVCYLYLRDNIQAIIVLRWESPSEVMVSISELVFGLMIRVVLSLFVIGGLDFAYQKWNHSKELRMTLQEVKQERKQYEVSPEVKRKMRMIQMEMTRKRMLQDVPTADVVLANPTHYAVALKYDRATMAAPIVVAKGPDLLAQKIKQVAKEHGVPVVEKPALTRALYAAVDIGCPIPSQMFVAVAEVLAMVMRLRKKRKRAKR